MIKRLLLFVLILMFGWKTFGQNKTLGVGVASPNSNAALHVESPTGNQGFIMPRLTTTQRTAMGGLLTTTDQGLMLYDTDLKTIYIWDGASWKSTAQVAGGSKLSYPYKDSVTTNPPAGVNDVFALKYNGTNNARVMRVESVNPNNLSSALSVLQQGRGLAGYFEQANDTTSTSALFARIRTNRVQTNLAPVAVYGEATGTGALGGAFWNVNPANTYPALYSRTLGAGSAASFEIQNAANSAPVLFLKTDGTGNALQTPGKIQAGQFIGDGSGLTNLPVIQFPFADTLTNLADGQSALSLTNNNTGAGGFGLISLTNLNPQSSFSPLFINNVGTNGAADMLITNATNTNDVIGATTNGLGRAGFFNVNNTANNSSALLAQTNGIGRAIQGISTGTGAAANFLINNVASSASSVNASTNGTGAALFGSTSSGYTAVAGQHNGSSNGFGGLFEVTNASNTYQAIKATTAGTGGAARFENTNAAGTNPNVESVTNSPGGALRATSTGTGYGGWLEINNASGSASALEATTNGIGKAGNFSINNPSNADNTIRVTTNGTGDNGWFEVTNSASTGSPVVGITNGIGVAGFFQVNNATSGTTAIQGITNSNVGGATPPVAILGTSTGTGASAGSFRINNASNPYASLYSETNGTGYAVMAKQTNATGGNTAYFEMSNASNPGSAMYAKTFGTGNAVGGLTTGTGTAARFEVSNSGNSSSAIEAVTDGTGSAVQINQTNGGFAIELLGGGVKISSATYAAPVSITIRAALYEISSGSGLVTLPVTGPVGETCWVSNTTGSSITVSGSAVANSSVRQFIRLTGGWQIVN